MNLCACGRGAGCKNGRAHTHSPDKEKGERKALAESMEESIPGEKNWPAIFRVRQCERRLSEILLLLKRSECILGGHLVNLNLKYKCQN